MELEITKGGGDRPVCGPKAKKRVKWEHLFTVPTQKRRATTFSSSSYNNSFTAVTSTSVSRGGGGGDRTKPPSPVVSPNVAWARKETPFFNVAMGDNGLSGRRRRVYTHGGGGGGPGPFGDEPTQLDIWEEGGNRMAGGRSARHRRCGSPVVSLCPPPPFCGIA